MKTEDHKILAEYLMEVMDKVPNNFCKKAFSYGCISPDINVFTYFKGSIHNKMLHGHNYLNSKGTILKLIRKLWGREKWGVISFYRLGKLIHYVTDSFTYAHNDFFKGSIKEHVLYEKELHKSLNYIWKSDNNEDYEYFKNIICSNDIYRCFQIMHKLYEEDMKGFYIDIHYIKGVTKFILNSLMESDVNEKEEIYSRSSALICI